MQSPQSVTLTFDPMNPANAQRKNARALAALSLYLSNRPSSPLTVWQSGKVHGGMGKIGVEFATVADAESAICALGYSVEYRSEGFTEFAHVSTLAEVPTNG